MSTLYVIWQNPISRRWYPVGRLTRQGATYKFVYTRGAQSAENFEPFGRMADLLKEYSSEDLFPLFSNRLLARSRPEYESYLGWLGTDRTDDPLLILARTGGSRATDSLLIYPRPEKNADGKYETHFFCHGIRHLPSEALPRINALKPNEALYPLLDMKNPFDPLAIGLRTADPPFFIGYCPRHIAADVKQVLDANLALGRQADIRAVKANPDAPLQYRLLVCMIADWPSEFRPCSAPEFEPVARTTDAAA